MNLEGATLLVTGGGSGVGRQLAVQAAGRGARIVIWDRDEAAGRATAEQIGAAASHQVVDVTDSGAVVEAARATGTVDVLVNCAGVVSGQRLLDASEAQIRRTFEVNTLALYWTTRAFLPAMLERRSGTVVTIASAAGLVGVARQTDYSASKWAAIGFTESLRAELRGTGVGTLAVEPFYIDTGMFAGVRTRFPRLLPILKEADVAARVLDAIERDRPVLAMPPLVRTLPVLRALPTRAFDAVVDFFGVNHTMDHFVGRR
ncbi:MAG: SDR family oxidoreductase [Propionicimonas sp.]|uniref:SDR family oxidoreductase n=1 Tax=Propionicimonas sp. TaxID=1955623 RepID=UPI003D118BE7